MLMEVIDWKFDELNILLGNLRMWYTYGMHAIAKCKVLRNGNYFILQLFSELLDGLWLFHKKEFISFP